MILLFKILFLIIIFISGLLANNLEPHLKPSKIINPLLFNMGKIISYFLGGIIIGFFGFLIKINGFNGGILLLIFGIGVLVVTISHLPIFPKILVIGLHSHHHPKKSFPAGLLNIFASSATLHIVMIISLAHGYYLESGLIMLIFAIGTLYIPLNFNFNLPKTYKIIQGIFFLIFTLFIFSKGLLYTEKYLFSPFEHKKRAIVPELLNRIQYLKTDTNELSNRILMSKGLELNWMLVGQEQGDTIYIPRYRHKSVLNNTSQFLNIKSDNSGFIYFTGNLGKGDYVIKVLDDIVDVYDLPYEVVLDSGYGDDIHGEDYINDIKIPNINITEPGIATIQNGTQQVDIMITKDGYKPSVIFLKKGIPAVVNFIGQDLTEDNKRIIMPSYNEYLEFVPGDNPINIPNPLIDFIFYSWKSQFGGYILIVDDLENMDKEKAERQIRMFNVNGI